MSLASMVWSTGKVTEATRSRSVPRMTSCSPAMRLSGEMAVMVAALMTQATATVLPLARERVTLPLCAVSGTFTFSSPALLDAISASTLPSAAGNATLVMRSRLLPVMVSVAPFFTGEGAALRLVGTTVWMVPAGTSTPDLRRSITSPSVASAGSVKTIWSLRCDVKASAFTLAP